MWINSSDKQVMTIWWTSKWHLAPQVQSCKMWPVTFNNLYFFKRFLPETAVSAFSLPYLLQVWQLVVFCRTGTTQDGISEECTVCCLCPANMYSFWQTFQHAHTHTSTQYAGVLHQWTVEPFAPHNQPHIFTSSLLLLYNDHKVNRVPLVYIFDMLLQGRAQDRYLLFIFKHITSILF